MKFKIMTLIDITETNASRGAETLYSRQQQNFNTMYNVLGLRTNPTDFKVSVENKNLNGLGFGAKHKGKHNVWTVDFTVEAEGSTNIEVMQADFDLIPVLSNLTETVKDQKMFITLSNPQDTNIIFLNNDK